MDELINVFQKFSLGIPVLFSHINKSSDTLLQVADKVLWQMFYFNVDWFLAMNLKPNE
jgi:hypothetical protein